MPIFGGQLTLFPVCFSDGSHYTAFQKIIKMFEFKVHHVKIFCVSLISSVSLKLFIMLGIIFMQMIPLFCVVQSPVINVLPVSF